MSTHELQFNESPTDERHLTNMEPTPFQWSPPKFQKPLSELTEHLTHIPIRDMEDWVHRPTEIRHRQASGMNGKVARPMNCFMLYRSAYADRTKECFSLHNHQWVSQLTGKSWTFETPEIKRKYRRLASIEKINHAIAHPFYKFAPKQKVQQPKKDEQFLSLSHSSIPDSEPALDQDYAKCLMESGDRSVPVLLSPLQHGLPMITHPNSTWLTKIPSSPSSKIVQTGNGLYHYLQPNNPQHLKGCHIEDGWLSTIELQDSWDSSPTVLVGLPEATDHDHRLPQSSTLTAGMSINSVVDSQLLGHYGDSSNSIAAPQVYSRSQHPVWQDIPTNNGYLPATNASSALNSIVYPADSHYDLMGEYKAWESTLRLNMSTPSDDFGGWLHPQEAIHDFDGFQ